MARQKGMKSIADNRKAFHDYFILETVEAGIVLAGTEVKSLRAGKMNLKDSYVQVKDGEMWLIGAHISPYEQGNRENKDPIRTRKLLMQIQRYVMISFFKGPIFLFSFLTLFIFLLFSAIFNTSIIIL